MDEVEYVARMGYRARHMAAATDGSTPMPAMHALYWIAAYTFVVLCFVAPPPGIQALGFTVQAIFHSALGSPVRNYLGYHVKCAHTRARTLGPASARALTGTSTRIPRARDARVTRTRARRRTMMTIVSHAVLAAGYGLVLLYLSWMRPGGIAWPAGWGMLHTLVPVLGALLVAAGAGVYFAMAWLWRHPSRHWVVLALRAHSATQPDTLLAHRSTLTASVCGMLGARTAHTSRPRPRARGDTVMDPHGDGLHRPHRASA